VNFYLCICSFASQTSKCWILYRGGFSTTSRKCKARMQSVSVVGQMVPAGRTVHHPGPEESQAGVAPGYSVEYGDEQIPCPLLRSPSGTRSPSERQVSRMGLMQTQLELWLLQQPPSPACLMFIERGSGLRRHCTKLLAPCKCSEQTLQQP
jgi:hypothetical protein